MGRQLRLSSFLLLAFLLIVGKPAVARCAPAEDFGSFLVHYEADREFQGKRIAASVIVNDLAGSDPPDVPAIHTRMKRKPFLDAYGVFPHATYRSAEKLETEIKSISKSKVLFRVFAPASDSYDRHYIFSNRHGCWRLTEFSRESL